jgi:hypothetical protein
MTTPAQGAAVPSAAVWASDNGCFGKGYPGGAAYLRWLENHPAPREDCLFASAPDVVGNAAATLDRSAPYLEHIRALGYRAALVAQDGLEDLAVPWGTFDVLFIGGGTDWKLGPGARGLAEEARARGLWVHMGRVNSLKRLRYARRIGCGSADGTFITFAPTENLARCLRWLEALDDLDHLEAQAPGLF